MRSFAGKNSGRRRPRNSSLRTLNLGRLPTRTSVDNEEPMMLTVSHRHLAYRRLAAAEPKQ
jgi:hypothetical protein